MSYNPTTWVDNETPVNAANLNNIEQGIKANSDAIGDIESALDSIIAMQSNLIGGEQT